VLEKCDAWSASLGVPYAPCVDRQGAD
jgi:hypothetical protein